jgi:hypothetical protein
MMRYAADVKENDVCATRYKTQKLTLIQVLIADCQHTGQIARIHQHFRNNKALKRTIETQSAAKTVI